MSGMDEEGVISWASDWDLLTGMCCRTAVSSVRRGDATGDSLEYWLQLESDDDEYEEEDTRPLSARGDS